MSHFVRLIFTCLLAVTVLGVLGAPASAQVEPRPVRKGTKYTTTIDSSPQQAAIYLDDKKYGIVGYTPYTGKLVTGDYKLILELPGFKPIERVIRVDRKNRSFFLPMERQELPGTIDLQATADPNVAGAQVIIDGVPQGTAPLVYDVKEGRHRVEVKKDGFLPFEQWLDVKQGQRITLTPVLKSAVKKGSLLVDADVAGADVFVDGKPQPDGTPTVVDNLDEGPHVVEVKKAGVGEWKQTVTVRGGERVRVTADLGSAAKRTGTVKILSSTPGAEVWIDGVKVGAVPYEAQLAPGEHLVEVRVAGQAPKEERVTVVAGGNQLVKLDPAGGGGAANTPVPTGGTGLIRVVSPVPEARVFIDGADAGLVPTEKQVPAGEHFVIVQKDGYGKFQEKVTVAAGQTVNITATLGTGSMVRFLSTPDGAEVVLDGRSIGKTPLEIEIEGGDHVVTLRLEGYHDFEQQLSLKGGATGNVSAQLVKVDDGPTAEQIVARKATLSSYSARVMPYGDFTADVSLGYPYWLDVHATVGGIASKRFGWDLALGLRSLLTNWELYAQARVQYFQAGPFALAGFAMIGGGGGLDGRNQFTLQVGALNTVTFAAGTSAVTVTGRAYLDVWSDRLCGVEDDGSPVAGAPDICSQPAMFAEALEAFGISADEVLDRDNGVRGYLSLILEVAVTDKTNVFLILEGAPFQDPRAALSEEFNPTLFSRDQNYSGRLGMTFKF